MALEDKKISDLDAATDIASDDLLVVVDSSKHLTKKITFANFKKLGGFFGGFQSSTLIDDKTHMGVTDNEVVVANSEGFGGALCIDSAGHYTDASGLDISTAPCVALALATGIGEIDMLVFGLVRNDAWTWTPGALIFLSTTPGQLTQSVPTGSGTLVQAVGIAQTPVIMFFNPSYTMVKRIS